VGFLPGCGLQTQLRLKLVFQDPEKIRDLARKSEGRGTSEDRMMLEHGIEKDGARCSCG
jgi:hypothetical protein